jgi:aspartate/methionine/tyrosine aminotransferase
MFRVESPLAHRSEPWRGLPAGLGTGSFQISDRACDIPPALSIYINQIVYDLRRRGEDIVVLSLGEAFFSIPLFDFSLLDLGKCYHYSDSQGIPELRRKIASYYGENYDALVDPDREVLVTAGSKAAIFMAMQATLNPGDELLIHEPAWLSYQEQARLVGATPCFIPFNSAPRDFKAWMTPRTRMLVISNPNNPAGRIYSRAELTELYDQCRERGVYLLVDEAYSDFVMDEPFVSLAQIAPDKVGAIVVNSLSKNMGLSGWRVGYTIAHPDLIRHLLKLNQHLLTCAPSILSYYLARYFDDIVSVTLPQVRQVVDKRKRIARTMDTLNLRRLGGASTFYFFVSIEDFPGSDMDFALSLLLERGIAVVPGSAYGASTSRFIRVSIGTESEARVAQALVTIRDLIAAKEFDRDRLRARVDSSGIPAFQR